MAILRLRTVTSLAAALLTTAPLLAQPSPEPPPAEPAPEPAPPPAEEPAPAEEPPPEVSEEELLAAEDPARPPSAGKGVLWGVVTDTKFNEPMVEAPVAVVGTRYSTVTDLEGRFRLELPPGKYQVRVQYELHQAARFEVTVVRGEVLRVDAALTPDETVETIEVEVEIDGTSVEGQSLSRRKAASVGDGVGRAEMARSPDRNAAEAAQRVVGASIVGGRFVYVRGLGERYTNAQLNGAPLPSPEPDRATVPLDLFPALVLDSITITKSFTPDAPGDFAGGSVRIATRELPRQTLFQVSLGGGYNTESTFRQRLVYRGGESDWLGWDDGTRALPRGLPGYNVSRGPRPDGTSPTPEEVQASGRSLNAFMTPTTTWTPPNHSLSVVAGDSFSLGEGQKLGTLGSLNYSRGYVARRNMLVRKYGISTDMLLQRTTADVFTEQVRWGAFGSASWAPDEDHRLSLGLLHSQSSDDEVREQATRDEESDQSFHYARLSFVSRALSFVQLRGEHDLAALGDAELAWNANWAIATRDEPDSRETLYQLNGAGTGYTFAGGASGGSHFWSDQSERTVGAGLDWTQPFEHGDAAASVTKLKGGGLVSLRSREFDARRFLFERDRAARTHPDFTCDGPAWDRSCPDRLFVPENIGPVIDVQETTRPEDAYEAGLDVMAAYLMTDAAVTPELRVVVGQRIEVTRQSVSTFQPLGGATSTTEANLRSTDWLPSVGMVWALTPQVNLRSSFTRTLARPQLRELAPFSFVNYFGDYPIQGNPELRLTRIWNGDLRLEAFPTAREVLALSLFAKRFEDPIEEVVLASAQDGIITYTNAPSATLLGAELEARQGLGPLAPALEGFALVGNLTLARSRVEVDETTGLAGLNVTNPSRPLSQQSPWIVNLALDWEDEALGLRARLLYNVYGRRIVRVGVAGRDDFYEQPRHQVDATVAKAFGKQFELKLNATNLLLADHVVTQGAERRAGDANTTQRWSPGISTNLTASFTY